MVFEEGAKTIIFALIGCSGIFAYLGISLGNEKDRTGQKHFPLKLFLIMLSVLLITASVGLSDLIAQSQCGQCGETLGCADGTCTEFEQYVINMTLWVFICLMIGLLFVIGYFIVLFINWILHYLNARKSRNAWLEGQYTQGRGSGDGSENEKQ